VSDLIVLCYHAVSDRWPAPLSITAQQFRSQLGLLVSRGFAGATFTEAIIHPPVGRTVVVTFDDGYRSVLELAKPVLDELGLPGTVFVPTAYPDRSEPMAWPGIREWLGTEFEHELTSLTWSELGALARDGWEIGSHTRTHPHLSELDDGELGRELAGSRADCARALDIHCRSLAYPYGDHDERVVAAARRAGYEAAATLPSRLHRGAPLRWPRIGVYHADDMRRFKFKVSPSLRMARQTRAWGTLERLRRS
jgi:peptidoglycan/xylan/chitin deacetylase (PgdA/CDA1 family)